MNISKDLMEEVAALAARRPDKELLMLFRRRISSINSQSPELAKSISRIISTAGGVGATRKFSSIDELPKDSDSGIELIIRHEDIGIVQMPILSRQTTSMVERFIREREMSFELRKAGITPPSSLALVGKPGTGKTSLARWIASKLSMPFMILNIAGVVTSYLGQTGQNIKKALDRAKIEPCVLLLDEFDALGYYRGNDDDIGEMKRVVTVLLQEVENWPEQSIIVSATNMPELIDPAFKRRFSRWIGIPLPDQETRVKILQHYYGSNKQESLIKVAAAALAGLSGAELQRFITQVRTSEVVDGLSPKVAFWNELSRELNDREPEDEEKEQFIKLAREVDPKFFTFRKLGAALKLSHTTIIRLNNN